MAAISCACIRDLLIWGSAMERMMRMIAITINSSMSEKPCWFRRLSRFKDDIRFTSYDVATGVSVVSVGVLFCRLCVGRKGLEPNATATLPFVDAGHSARHTAPKVLKSTLT